jgi:hypothetical protein
MSRKAIASTIPDLCLKGKLKTIRTVPDPENNEQVLFSLVFQRDAEQDEGKGMLDGGCRVLDAEAVFILFGVGTGFEDRIRCGSLQKVSANVTGDASLKVSFIIHTAVGLQEMLRLWEAFLPVVGTAMEVLGTVRQRELPLGDVTVRAVA